MKIAIRADGSNAIGMGHIYNSLAVAEVLLNKGMEVYFITKSFPEAVEKLCQAGYVVYDLDSSLTERKSFMKTIQIMWEKQTSFLVTDLLEIQEDYSTELKKVGIRCIVMDILGKTKLKSDIVINRTTIKKRFKHYDKNQSTKYYLGPSYVSLRKQFIGLDKIPRQISPAVQKVLLCFGGGDEYNLSARVAWIMGRFSGISVTIILGAAFKLEEELQEIVTKLPKQPIILKDVKNIQDLFLQSDLVICAGGSILYELAITGTPAVVIAMNDHQVENAEEFAAFGSVISAGLHSEVEDQEIQEAIERSFDYQLRKKMSECGKKVTDGRGAERIVQIIYDFIKEQDHERKRP